MPLADLWALELVLAAFAGGAFGAAVGALPAFTVTGVLVVLGEIYALAARSLDAAVEPTFTSAVAFGPVFGPHVSFAGGAAAAAYAAKRGYLAEFDYHPAKNILEGLGARPDVLAVGGVFGVVGYWAATLAGSLSAPWDPVAFGVVASALAHRLALGYDLVGAPAGRLLDMRPFEEAATDGGEVVADAADGGVAAGDATGLAVEPWLPYQYRWSHVAALGVAVGALGGYVAYATASAFLAFGVSVVVLVYVNAGVDRIPITHHVTLPASTAVVALAGGATTPAGVAAAVPLGVALAAGAAFGLFGALVGELAQRALYAHADTHLDPPAASIVVSTLAIALLAWVGVLPSSAWVPTP